MNILKFILFFMFVMPISEIPYVKPKKMKRLNSHLN